MSDETTETTETTPEITEVPAVGFVQFIKSTVKTAITNDMPYNKFIGKLVEKQISDWAELIEKGYDALVKHAQEIQKVRPKSPGMDINLQPLPPQYTAEDAKKLQELKEKSAKIEAAINKVLSKSATSNEWKALKDAIAKNS